MSTTTEGREGRCPECGAPCEIREWSEARPWGSTVAYEPMGEIVPTCDCDTDDRPIEDFEVDPPRDDP